MKAFTLWTPEITHEQNAFYPWEQSIFINGRFAAAFNNRQIAVSFFHPVLTPVYTIN